VLFFSERFGHEAFSNLDAESKLLDIHKNPRGFEICIILELVEHSIIISLAITLFIAYGQLNLILGTIWLTSRITEALIQIYDKKQYWGLLSVARKYTDSTESGKKEIISSGKIILKRRNLSFIYAQILFFIGTLSYSSSFVIYDIIPVLGWFGIVASITYGVGSIVYLVKNNSKIIWSIGGLLILLFELLLGGWLVFTSIFIP
jgi:hypothetical protein